MSQRPIGQLFEALQGPEVGNSISDLAELPPLQPSALTPQGNRSSVTQPAHRSTQCCFQILQHCCPRMDHSCYPHPPPSPHPASTAPCFSCDSLLIHTGQQLEYVTTVSALEVYPCPHYGESETYLIFIYKVGGGLYLIKQGIFKGLSAQKSNRVTKHLPVSTVAESRRTQNVFFHPRFLFLKQGTKNLKKVNNRWINPF